MPTKKSPAATAPQVADGNLVATLRDGRIVRIPVELDLDEMLDLAEKATELDDNGQSSAEQVRALRAIIPDSFREALAGVPAAESLPLLTAWIEAAVEPLGKLHTS